MTYEIAKRTPRRAMMRVMLVLAAAATLVAVPVRRAEARNLFMPSVSDQKKAGDEAAQQVERQYKSVGGARLARVQRVGNRLVAALPNGERNTWNFRFHVLDNKEVNAFALPGGNLFIFTGLLDRLGNDNELAAVMGHEMAHVYKEHWAHMAAASQTRALGLSAILGITKAGRGWYNVAGVANSLMDLRYSRSDEDQADAAGLYNMRDAGYNPHGMIDLFRVLQKAGSEGNTPAFLRDHPLTSERIQKTEQRIARMR